MYKKSEISKVAIVYASRYGSTKQVSGMIADHIALDVNLYNVEDIEKLPNGYDLIILGSGIYGNKFLPEMESFIDNNRADLLTKPIAMFGVAMRLKMILDKYDYLNPIVKSMLHGRMDFSTLTDEDREGLERFYDIIDLTEEQKEDRRKFRDEISIDECRQFAGKVLSLL